MDSFTRIVERYGGDHQVRTLSCAEQYRSMDAQLLPMKACVDIETCLSGIETLSMGFRQPVRRSTLADNERRDWRIHAALAQRRITQARTKRRRRRTGVGPDQYRLRSGLDDHRSVPAVFPWAHFRTTKAAVKMHTARPAGQHSYPHLGWQAARRSCPGYALAGSRSHLRRGSWLRRLCPPLCDAPSRGLLRHACQVEHRLIASIRRRRIARPASFATRPSPTALTRQDYPELLHASASKSRQDAGRITNNFSLPAATICGSTNAGRWNSSSSGCIFGSSSSTARRRTR